MCLDCGRGRGRLDGQKNVAMGLCTYAEVPCCAGTTGRPMKATDPSEGGSKATFQLKPLENFNERERGYLHRTRPGVRNFRMPPALRGQILTSIGPLMVVCCRMNQKNWTCVKLVTHTCGAGHESFGGADDATHALNYLASHGPVCTFRPITDKAGRLRRRSGNAADRQLL